MSVDLTALIRPRDLDDVGTLAPASAYFMFDSAGWTLPRRMSVADALEAAIGANYARTLNVDVALSASVQAVEVGGVASALKIATDSVEIAGELTATSIGAESIGVSEIFESTLTGLAFFGGAPTTKPTVTGSRGGNAALTSLLIGLDALNLINDNTSA